MNRIGFIVVNQRNGFIAEGKDHAAKIFDTVKLARSACKPLSSDEPMSITYERVVYSLLQGAAFCFVTQEGHERFLKALRNDPAHRPFTEYSADRSFIRWRPSNEKQKSEAKSGIDPRVDSNASA